MEDNNYNSTETQLTNEFTEKISKEEVKISMDAIKELEETVKKATAEIKPLRTRIKEHKAIVTRFMLQEKKKDIEMPNRKMKVELHAVEKKIKPKKEDILRRMTEFLQDAEKAQEMYDFVFVDEIETNEKIKFKQLTKKRQSELEEIKKVKKEKLSKNKKNQE